MKRKKGMKKGEEKLLLLLLRLTFTFIITDCNLELDSDSVLEPDLFPKWETGISEKTQTAPNRKQREKIGNT